MNKKKLLALLVSSAFLFAACGDDDSPSSPKKNTEEISSSSEDDECDSDECEDVSSSSKKSDNKSSSSKKDDKKSSDSKDDNKKSSDSKDEKSSSSKAEDKSSSSKDDAKSSSSVKDNPTSSSSAADAPKSSSATAESSSSVVVPSGARAAKLEDLEKNIELNLFGQKVFLSTGSKQGLIALRIPDELWIITYTDFANGIVKFEKDNVGIQYSDTDAAKAIKNKLDDGFKLSFIVDKDGVAKYAVDDSKEYSEAVKASVALQSGKVSKAEDVKDKVYKCTDGDTTRAFTFFDNSYILENSVADKVVKWIGGHYDIQRSTLLMRPAYYNAKSMTTMFGYTVGTDNTITSTGSDAKAMSCTVKNLGDITYPEGNKIVGEWQALDNGIEWQFTLKADGTYELAAFENNKNIEAKTGIWEIYGNQLMMRNKGCMNTDKCTTSIHGEVKSEANGFSFKHSDPDTPKIPTAFEAVQYE
ncbi:MAG: hypothetical protein IKS96_05005 [Fibrobacter sp.]|nr:hypothetical protein [Fibrobacter sp.]